MTGCDSSPGSRASLHSIGSLASLGSIGSLASIGSIGSIASIGSIGSIASIGSAGSIARIGSRGSIADIRASGGVGTSGEPDQADQGARPCVFKGWPVYLAAVLLLPALLFLILRNKSVGSGA